MKPQIGVIVPIYNVREYLIKCIDSIVNQTYRNLEIILVDDGSDDGSSEICDEYAKADERVKAIHQINKGVSAARFNGLCNTNCEYITFVDADDWIDIHTYERVSTYIEKGYDVVSFGIIRYWSEDEIHFNSHHYLEGFYNRERLEKEVFPTIIWDTEKHRCGMDAALWNKVIRRSYIEQIMGDFSKLGIHYGEDVATIYYALLQAKSLVLINDYLYYHRQRVNGEIAPYIKDKDYVKKLFQLYCFMKNRLGNDPLIIKQLEYFFLHGMEVRLWLYGDRRSISRVEMNDFVFPFEMIDKGKRIILYGAGKVGKTYHKQVLKTGYCDIVYWIDKAFMDGINESEISSVKYMDRNTVYDYVVVAIAQRRIYEEIKKDLISNGVEPELIIWGEEHNNADY